MKTLMRAIGALFLFCAIFIVSKKSGILPCVHPVANTLEAATPGKYALAYNDEVTLKYMYGSTVMFDCTGRNKKLINGVCETGIRVNESSTPGSGGRWYCKFHYEFSDGSTNGPYSETNTAPCFID
ncbi:hypothetical protein [Chitinophaga sp. RAB17]|uniref:hypothetical protein n=1 Tax=Chitinophaga sp. RAB17 TaxID=3233049 RepID=UPI003F92ABC0